MKNDSRSRKKDDAVNNDVESSQAGRRGLLKRLVAGGTAGAALALPAAWTRPVVQSVVLPAHAQTSPGEEGDFFLESPPNGALSFRSTDTEVLAEGRGLLEWLIPSARAGAEQQPPDCGLCGLCGRLRDGRLALFVVGTPFSFESSQLDCFQGEGRVGDDIDFSAVNGEESVCPPPLPLRFVGVEGETPNRRVVISFDGGEFDLVEDTARRCVCEALNDCPELVR